MKATLLILALLGVAISTEVQSPTFLVDLSDLEKTSCYYVTDFTIFDLQSLYKEGGYTNAGYKFSFCKSLDVANKSNSNETLSTFAYKESSNQIYADGDLIAASSSAVADDDGTRHLKYTLNSDEVCQVVDDVN